MYKRQVVGLSINIGFSVCRFRVHDSGEFGFVKGKDVCYVGLCYFTENKELVCFDPPILDIKNYSKGKSLCDMVKDSCLWKQENSFGDYSCYWDEKERECYCFSGNSIRN